MRKLITAILVVALTAGSCFSQSAALTWGKAFSGKELGLKYFSVLSNNEDGITLLVHYPALPGTVENMGIVKLDKSMNFISATKIPLKMDNRKLVYETMLFMKDATLLLTSYLDKDLRKTIVYSQEFNTTNRTFGKPSEFISFSNGDKKGGGGLSYAVSMDSKMLAVLYSPPASLAAQEKFTLRVFDNSLKELYSVTDNLPFRDKEFTLVDVQVTNTGNVFFSGIKSTGPYKPFSNKPNYDYIVLSASEGKKGFDLVKIDLGESIITSLEIGCVNDNTVAAAGFYSDKALYSIKGCFSVFINANSGAVDHKSLKEFDLDFITEGMSAKQAEKAEKKAEKGKDVEMTNIELRDLILRSDGGVVLVGEEYYSQTYTTGTQSSGYSTKTKYFYKQILVVGIDPNGDIDQTSKIVKSQVTESNIVSSYAMAIDGGKMYFIFTDNVKNLTGNYDGVASSDYSGKGIASIVTLDGKGEVKRQQLYPFAKFKTYPMAAISEDLGNGEMLLGTGYYSMLKLTVRFCKVNLRAED